ncbi:helix-turn-helix domain-containing protein [Spongiibacter sp.]|uniref:helix-turn-helix domain-containing protein n=1 Tax=Spongiibacter sp. TaxID=2024860 RepID=UPI0025799F84|nr:helix-turn-helix domain-containing protein [Spongiibacter sp.]
MTYQNPKEYIQKKQGVLLHPAKVSQVLILLYSAKKCKNEVLPVSDETSYPALSPGPLVTKRLFSQMSGLSEETIRGMIERGYLPSTKIGKHRLVNVALLSKDALEAEFEK